MALTAPYPNNSRAAWVREYLAVPTLSGGFLQFAYALYPNQKSKDAGDRPFLFNSHKAMVRETHHRIITRPSGALLHVSGAEVLPVDLEDFLTNDPAASRWVNKTGPEWVDDQDRRLTPLMFPSYQGVLEALDPQWPREPYFLPQALQLATILERYDRSVETRRLAGDRRDTTLDLQVGASSDDFRLLVVDTSSAPHSWTDGLTTAPTAAAGHWTGSGGTFFGVGLRFLSATIPQASTIDVAHLTFTVDQNQSGTVVRTNIYGEDADNPGTFSTIAEYNGRSKTSAVVWDGLSTWTAEGSEDSPSLVTPLQTIIDRAGFVSGNAVVFQWEDDDSDTGSDVWRLGYSYDNDTAKAPKLHVEYTAPPFRPKIISY